MITAWMLYAVAISLLLTAAASLAEGGLRRLGAPVRGVWLGALSASLLVSLLPLAGTRGPLVLGSDATGTAALPEGAPVLELPALVVPTDGLLARLDEPLLAAWGAGSAAVLAVMLIGALGLWVRRRRWPLRIVDGRPVLVAPDFGPAVVGLSRPSIVLPEWALGLGEEARRLVLLHEEEHRGAGDVLALTAGALAVATAPWNPALWIQLRRLRGALELDCDRRVLRRGAPALDYAKLLLRVSEEARFVRASLAAVPALGEPVRTLERRIDAIVARGTARGRWIAGLALAGSVLLVGLACETPLPTEATLESPVESAAEPSGSTEVERLGRQPTFTPYTVAPRLVNEAEVQAALEKAYPPLLRDAGIGGRVLVYFFIDESGAVRDTRINQSSGHQALDGAALEVAGAMEFSPALNRDQRRPVWISLPITFQVR